MLQLQEPFAVFKHSVIVMLQLQEPWEKISCPFSLHVTFRKSHGKNIMSIFFTRHILQEPWKNIMFIFFTRHILQELLRKEKAERQFCNQLSRKSEESHLQ